MHCHTLDLPAACIDLSLGVPRGCVCQVPVSARKRPTQNLLNLQVSLTSYTTCSERR